MAAAAQRVADAVARSAPPGRQSRARRTVQIDHQVVPLASNVAHELPAGAASCMASRVRPHVIDMRIAPQERFEDVVDGDVQARLGVPGTQGAQCRSDEKHVAEGARTLDEDAIDGSSECKLVGTTRIAHRLAAPRAVRA